MTISLKQNLIQEETWSCILWQNLARLIAFHNMAMIDLFLRDQATIETGLLGS